MQSVGTRLREARERKGFSLDEINARTRINSRNLTAIEADEVADISSPFFYRSFVRQYAEEVGLDFKILSPAVELLAGNMRQPDLPGQGEHQPVRVAPIQARPKRDYSWMVPAAVFLGVVAIGSSGYAAWKYYKPLPFLQKSAVSSLFRTEAVSKPANGSQAGSETKNSALELSAAELPSAAVSGGKPAVVNTAVKAVATQALSSANQDEDAAASAYVPPAVTESQNSGDGIHLELAATERTWLTVSADGKPAYTGILEAAQVKVLEGQQSAKLRTGNAGGVNITFNGKSIGAIGPRGKTRTVVFTTTGYEVQPDTPKLTPANHIGG